MKTNVTPEQLREIALRCGNETLVHIEQGMSNEYQIVEFAAHLFAEFQKLQAEQEPKKLSHLGLETQLRQELATVWPMLEQSNAYSAKLTKERDQLATQNQALREALESHSGNYKLSKAECVKIDNLLNLPDLATDIIRKWDAKTLRKAAEHLESYEYIKNQPSVHYAEALELRRMATELENRNE